MIAGLNLHGKKKMVSGGNWGCIVLQQKGKTEIPD
jgi:hypothetical protein